MISAPLDFVHEVHVGFDSETQEFSGLPDTWRSLLKISGTYSDCRHVVGSIVSCLPTSLIDTSADDPWLCCEHSISDVSPGLTKEEISKNPQGMLDVLGFYTDGQGGPPAPGNAPSDAGKYMVSSPGPVSGRVLCDACVPRGTKVESGALHPAP